jgi:hypothetical protein
MVTGEERPESGVPGPNSSSAYNWHRQTQTVTRRTAATEEQWLGLPPVFIVTGRHSWAQSTYVVEVLGLNAGPETGSCFFMVILTTDQDNFFSILSVDTICSELLPASVAIHKYVFCSWWTANDTNTRAAESGFGPLWKIFWGHLTRADQWKIFTLNQLWLGLGLRVLIFICNNRDTTKTDENPRNTVWPWTPFRTARCW